MATTHDTFSITIVWDVYDVQELAPDLTIEQAASVLQYVSDEHDAEVGINWTVIKNAIIHLYGEIL